MPPAGPDGGDMPETECSERRLLPAPVSASHRSPSPAKPPALPSPWAMVRSLRRPDEEGRAGGSCPQGRLPPSAPPAPSHGGSRPGCAAGAAREGEPDPALRAGERRSGRVLAAAERRESAPLRKSEFLLSIPTGTTSACAGEASAPPDSATWLSTINQKSVHFLL